MRLARFRIQNYRSIRDSGDIRIESLQALVGENNSGKSNCLRALHCFLTSGSGGMEIRDFNDRDSPCVIECEFGSLNEEEAKRLRPYLIGDKIILRKELRIHDDEAKDRKSVKAEYHGYQAEPRSPWLSIAKMEAENARPKWQEVAAEHGLIDYVQTPEGKVTKTSYKAGLERYLSEHNVEYDEPQLGTTHALGIPQNLLSALPELYLLPAITDYSEEIDRRSSSTVFRRLMADLSDRIMSADPRHKELEEALGRVHALLNCVGDDGGTKRLEALGGVETSLRDVMKKLMPSVSSIRLEVQVDASKDIFARGVTIRIDDGVLTDVVDKGHGMQRSVVFSLLQMLISSAHQRSVGDRRPIILAIEEPELYIHPHCQRLIFRVLREFAGVGDDDAEPTGDDQVIYTTHSPAFIEVWNYQRIGLVRKPDLPTGTVITQAARGILGNPDERKVFKMLTCFGLKHNEVFFAREAILVEGPEDDVGVIATARKLGKINELPDEIGVSVVVTGSKGEIPKFQRILNAFGLKYAVMLELDGKDEDHPQNAPILNELNGNRVAKIPSKLETLLGLEKHFDDQRHARQFFSDSNNINNDMESVVAQLLP
ncbi:ATP-dependent nuclease [Peristeroidobacter agariperforans]|uniref:ATP-dependent nuclease n=1 Tax=Peristeroidobacter agariperforans TaxID=268404 RepID=UPI00101BEEC5|nr:AAA family ATPase [Peristeroidobacter agariperforans]